MPPEFVFGFIKYIVEEKRMFGKKNKIPQVKNFNPAFAACPVFQSQVKKILEFRTVKI